jgi:type I restriction enzyme, S subunit
MGVKAGYQQTEVGIIPDDWNVLPFEEFYSFISYGFTNPMPTSESGIYMVTAKDINNGKIQFDTARFTTEEAYRALTAKSRPKKGDLLLTKDGALGRLALVDSTVICINQSVAIIRLNNRAVPEFLKILLEAPVYQNHMLEDAGGTTIKHIYITIVNKMPLAVPPMLAEQEAIAEALSDADALIEALEGLIAKKRLVKQGAMQELLTGKNRLAGFSEEWEEKALGAIFEITAGGDFERAKSSDGQSEHFPYPIYSNALTNKGLYGFCSYSDHQADSITVTARGTLGSANYRDHDFTAIGRVLVLNPLCRLDGRFISEYLNNRVEFVVESTGVPQLTAPQISNYEVLFPEYSEQTAIAEILSDMDAEIAVLEGKLSKARLVKQGMMSELLTGKVRLV